MDPTQILSDKYALTGSGETAWWLKCLSCYCEDLSLDPPNSCKTGCGDACPYSGRHRDPQEFTAGQSVYTVVKNKRPSLQQGGK